MSNIKLSILFPVVSTHEYGDNVLALVRNPVTEATMRMAFTEEQWEEFAHVHTEPGQAVVTKREEPTMDDIFSQMEASASDPFVGSQQHETGWPPAAGEMVDDEGESQIEFLRKTGESDEVDEELRALAERFNIDLADSKPAEKIGRDGNDLTEQEVVELVVLFTKTKGAAQRQAFMRLARPTMSILNRLRHVIPYEIREHIVRYKVKRLPVGPLGQGSGDIPQVYSHFLADNSDMEREFYDLMRRGGGNVIFKDADHRGLEEPLKKGEAELLHDMEERGGYLTKNDVASAVARLKAGAAAGIEELVPRGGQ